MERKYQVLCRCIRFRKCVGAFMHEFPSIFLHPSLEAFLFLSENEFDALKKQLFTIRYLCRYAEKICGTSAFKTNGSERALQTKRDAMMICFMIAT